MLKRIAWFLLPVFLVFANNSVYEPDIAQRVIDIIARLVSDGGVSPDRIHQSWHRIMVLKERIGTAG